MGLGRLELPTSRLSDMSRALVGARERWKQGDFTDSALVSARQRWWAMIQAFHEDAAPRDLGLGRCALQLVARAYDHHAFHEDAAPRDLGLQFSPIRSRSSVNQFVTRMCRSGSASVSATPVTADMVRS